MASGYTRQSSADIQAGLPIQSADFNNEYNQIQSAFDNTTGHDHSGSATGVGAKIGLATSVSGILPIANGGTNNSTAFTAGSVIFSNGTSLIQDNANFLYSSANHNLGLGGAALANWRLGIIGLGTTSSTFGLVVDNNTGAGVLWARDDGLISFPQYGNGALSVSGTALVSGTLAVANGGTGVTTSTGGGSVVLSTSPTLTTPTVTGTIAAAGWNITQAGAGTFNGNMNIGGIYQLGGVQIAASNLSNGTTGSGAVVLATSPTLAGTANFTNLNGSGTVATSASANQFGAASGNTTTPVTSTTNILFYNFSSTNWAGIGVDTAGSVYIANINGSSTAAAKVVFTNNANSCLFNVGIGVGVATSHQLQLVSDDAFKPNGGSWGNSSDARLKTNLVTEFDALAKIRQLKPTLFDWKNPHLHCSKAGASGSPTSGGFIAQELQEVFPDFISEDEPREEDIALLPDGEKVLAMQLPFKFYAYMVRTIQQLDAEVQELKAGIK